MPDPKRIETGGNITPEAFARLRVQYKSECPTLESFAQKFGIPLETARLWSKQGSNAEDDDGDVLA